MRRRLASALAAIALVTGLIGAFAAEPAAAYSSPFPAHDYACDGTEAVTFDVSLATNGFGVAWAYSGTVTPGHVNASCQITSVWNESEVVYAATIQRITFGGTVTCAYDLVNPPGTGQVGIGNYQLGGSGVCGSTSWPQGYTKLCVQVSAFHDGAEVKTSVFNGCVYDNA
jgi:hypothetical protein